MSIVSHSLPKIPYGVTSFLGYFFWNSMCHEQFFTASLMSVFRSIKYSGSCAKSLLNTMWLLWSCSNTLSCSCVVIIAHLAFIATPPIIVHFSLKFQFDLMSYVFYEIWCLADLCCVVLFLDVSYCHTFRDVCCLINSIDKKFHVSYFFIFVFCMILSWMLVCYVRYGSGLYIMPILYWWIFEKDAMKSLGLCCHIFKILLQVVYHVWLHWLLWENSNGKISPNHVGFLVY